MLICMRTGALGVSALFICVYSLPRWGARTEGAEEWTWEAEGRGLVPLGFLFSLEKNVVGIFFFSCLDLMPLFKERGKLRRDSDTPGPPRLSVGTAVAPELAVRSRPRTVGSRALHLMRLGCLSHPGAPVASLSSPSHAPTRGLNAHNPASLPTHWNAQERSAATSSPSPRHAPSVSNSGMRAAGVGGWGPC